MKPPKSRRGKKSKKYRKAKQENKKKQVKTDSKLNYNTFALALDLPVRDLRRFNPHLKANIYPLM